MARRGDAFLIKWTKSRKKVKRGGGVDYFIFWKTYVGPICICKMIEKGTEVDPDLLTTRNRESCSLMMSGEECGAQDHAALGSPNLLQLDHRRRWSGDSENHGFFFVFFGSPDANSESIAVSHEQATNYSNIVRSHEPLPLRASESLIWSRCTPQHYGPCRWRNKSRRHPRFLKEDQKEKWARSSIEKQSWSLEDRPSDLKMRENYVEV